MFICRQKNFAFVNHSLQASNKFFTNEKVDKSLTIDCGSLRIDNNRYTWFFNSETMFCSFCEFGVSYKSP